jgi:hypothetical protein
MSNRFFVLGILGAAAAVVMWLPPPAAAGQASRPPEPHNSCLSDDPALLWRCAQEKAKTFNPPRTADGKPDFSGYWRHRTEAKEGLEAPWDDTSRAGVARRSSNSDVPLGPGKSLVVDPPDGKLPLQPWAAAQRKENAAKYIDQNVQCFLSGAVRHMYEAPAYQIIQTPGYIAIPSEESHATRIITMANRPHLGKNIRLWQGDARGRWDGTTLVVESTNHNGRVFLDRQGTFYTDSAILTERFMMLDQDTIAYGATIDDPLVYTRPFTIAFLLTRHTTKGFEILEEACFEGEANTKRLNTLGFKTYPGITSDDVPAIKARTVPGR